MSNTTKVPNLMGPMKNKMRLAITHIPTGRTVSFPAYLENFSDMYTSEWNAEDVYGRMDPIATFISTRRSLSLSWNVPAASYEEAQLNLGKMNNLLSFLYPLYEAESVGGATAINQAPLVRISFGNLVRNPVTGKGLLGYLNGFTFDPDLEAGMFYGDPTKTRQGVDMNFDSDALYPSVEYLPKTFRVNTEFNVLHEHSLGFQRATSDNSGKTFSFRAKGILDNNYPYYSNAPAKYPNPEPAQAETTSDETSTNYRLRRDQPPIDPNAKDGQSTLKKIPKKQQNLNRTKGSVTATIGEAGGTDALMDILPTHPGHATWGTEDV